MRKNLFIMCKLSEKMKILFTIFLSTQIPNYLQYIQPHAFKNVLLIRYISNVDTF